MFTPTLDQIASSDWFTRSPLTNSVTGRHVRFPVVRFDKRMRCLCRDCTPAKDALEEERIQTAFKKAVEKAIDKAQEEVQGIMCNKW